MWHAGSSLQHAGSLVAACRLLSSCGTQALEHVGSVVIVRELPRCGGWAPEHTGSVVATRGLSSCGARVLECAGSVFAARRLSCPTACGILVPQRGIEPASTALEGRFLTTGPPGKSHS